MQQHDPQALAVGLLSVSRALVDGISAGVHARGFDDVRPAHGFAFARLAPDGATITQLAEHLDVTRQAAAQLVDELITKGYVQRSRHPGRAAAARAPGRPAPHRPGRPAPADLVKGSTARRVLDTVAG